MNQALTAVSLFTGAGGMDIGFEKAGVNVIFANELMKEAAETYKANHPGRTIVNDDINNVIEKMNNYEGTDLVFGGPPCQGFSVANVIFAVHVFGFFSVPAGPSDFNKARIVGASVFCCSSRSFM